MLLANLLVQVAACFIARQALVRSLKSLNHCVFADQGNPREGWSPDPLTQALTDLKAAKEQITEQKETIARMDDHFLTRREFGRGNSLDILHSPANRHGYGHLVDATH